MARIPHAVLFAALLSASCPAGAMPEDQAHTLQDGATDEMSMLQLGNSVRLEGDEKPTAAWYLNQPLNKKPGLWLGTADEPCVRPFPKMRRPACHPANPKVCSPKRGLNIPLAAYMRDMQVCKFLKQFGRAKTKPWWFNDDKATCALCPTQGDDYVGCQFNYDSGFVPMIHYASSYRDPLVAAEAVLGYYKPNHLAHGQLDPVEAAARWQVLQTKAGETTPLPIPRIGSPVASGADKYSWWNAFFNACNDNHGGCQVDFLQTHVYKSEALGPNSMQQELEALRNMYGLPIWLTEFNAGGVNANRPATEHFSFMEKALPYLEGTNFIEKYSWQTLCEDPDMPGARLLDDCDSDEPTLTSLGIFYRDFMNLEGQFVAPAPITMEVEDDTGIKFSGGKTESGVM